MKKLHTFNQSLGESAEGPGPMRPHAKVARFLSRLSDRQLGELVTVMLRESPKGAAALRRALVAWTRSQP